MTLSHTETDRLLEEVNQSLAAQTFDGSDRPRLQQMVDCLGDTRGMVRLGFAEALGQVGKPAVPFLLEALSSDPNPVVRRAAAKTLTLIGDTTTIPTLIRALLNDEDTVVRTSSVGALAKLGAASVPPLLEILRSPDKPETTKGLAAWALAFIGTKAKEQLYAAFDSEVAAVRSAVVGAIAQVAEEEPEDRAFELLVSSLDDPAENVRSEGAAALGKLGYQPAIPPLVELLGHPQGESRKAAALALMKMGDRASLEPLQAALATETDETVRRGIALAISLLKKQAEEDDWD